MAVVSKSAVSLFVAMLSNSLKRVLPMTIKKPIVYHFPICPFSQRIEILLALKKAPKDAVEFPIVDICTPRSPELLKKTRGTTSLPVMELPNGEIIKESLVILNYLDETIGAPIRRTDPLEHAIESMLIAKEGPFTMAGYTFVMNQDLDQRDDYANKMLALYRDINDFLEQHSPTGPFLFETFGLAETVFTPMFQRFWFLKYYEDFQLPDTDEYKRVKTWQQACLEHGGTNQVCHDEIVKIYYDYAKGAGNGGLIKGRKRSSFVFEPSWEDRPMPPSNKYEYSATDEELGLSE